MINALKSSQDLLEGVFYTFQKDDFYPFLSFLILFSEQNHLKGRNIHESEHLIEVEGTGIYRK